MVGKRTKDEMEEELNLVSEQRDILAENVDKLEEELKNSRQCNLELGNAVDLLEIAGDKLFKVFEMDFAGPEECEKAISAWQAAKGKLDAMNKREKDDN